MNTNEPSNTTNADGRPNKRKIATVIAIIGAAATILGALLNAAGVFDLFGEVRERWREERLVVSSSEEVRNATVEIEGLHRGYVFRQVTTVG